MKRFLLYCMLFLVTVGLFGCAAANDRQDEAAPSKPDSFTAQEEEGLADGNENNEAPHNLNAQAMDGTHSNQQNSMNQQSKSEQANDGQQAETSKTEVNDTPISPRVPDVPLRHDIKGIYVSGYATQEKNFEKLLKLLDDTELNAMVIDVKDDSGRITYDSNIPLAGEIGADEKAKITDVKALLQKLKDKKIYAIARIVTFKDPFLAAKKPEYAIHTKKGQVWRNNKGVSWVDPYIPEVQRYNLEIAKEVAALGFDEIQFDYVRFPENGAKLDREAAFRNENGWTKEQMIANFVKLAKEELHAAGKPVSADVFGLTTTVNNDMGIGQNWTAISPYTDFISPMTYPSHYGSGHYGIKHPDLEPHRLIEEAIKDAQEKNNTLKQQGNTPASIRPWLQDFTATWVKPHQTYKDKQVKEQIKALKELGIEQYLLWNANCKYSLKGG
ncbi:putative glycoside hydrolase [Paenibacillus turpanensis]|uniref:putative glycoside hydrolase n=1 Tax=Paenibacillus turpanensis TaxID=2689078 RepID=UPI001FB6D9A0|nr:putative glycoside hydrolase [Paenibacillus turpanensis]